MFIINAVHDVFHHKNTQPPISLSSADLCISGSFFSRGLYGIPVSSNSIIGKTMHVYYTFFLQKKTKSCNRSGFFLLRLQDFVTNCIFKINSAPNDFPLNPYLFSPYAHFPNYFHIIKSVQKFHIFIPFNLFLNSCSNF